MALDSKTQHQIDELNRAFSGLIDVERTKAKLDVYTIIMNGHDSGKPHTDILVDLLDWCKK